LCDIILYEPSPYILPAPLYSSLLRHLQHHRPLDCEPFLPSWSDSANGFKIVGRMKLHATLRLGHLSFRSKSSRANSSTAHTLATIQSGEGECLDLFAIEPILTHDVTINGTVRTTAFILGRRARRASARVFEDLLSSADVKDVLKLFWVHTADWRDTELVPVSYIHSDAVTVPHGDLLGVSPGEYQC
ncbi:hypothetical protein V8E36_000450, partial [Tilletia maclaganii]